MGRPAIGRENFHADHFPDMADRTAGNLRKGERSEYGQALYGLRQQVAYRRGQHPAAQLEVLVTVAIGEKATVANACKPVGQRVDEKAADELIGGERHVT